MTVMRPEQDLPTGYDLDLRYLLFSGANLLFEGHEAQDWIDRYRVADDQGCLDIYATARRLGVPVSYVSQHSIGERAGRTVGLLASEQGQDVSVLLATDLDEPHPVIHTTYGHELGHIWLEQLEDGFHDNCYGRSDLPLKIEDFCNYFGRQVALPVEEVIKMERFSVEEITQTAEKYKVSYGDVMLQLMKAGRIASKVYIDVTSSEDKTKVSRYCLCMNCELGHEHDKSMERIESIPVFDFREFGWYFNNPAGPSEPCANREWFRDMPLYKQLNIQYGNWTPADDKAVLRRAYEQADREKRDIEEMRANPSMPFISPMGMPTLLDWLARRNALDE